MVSRAVKDGVLEKLLEIEEKRLRKEEEDDEGEDDNQEKEEKMLQVFLPSNTFFLCINFPGEKSSKI